MRCKICEGNSVKIFHTRVLNKYEVEYFKCQSCGLIQTSTPFWLEEAYSSAITNLDIGLIKRNLIYSEVVEKFLLKGALNQDGKFLDYGGGYGMFVRIMRDKGFDFYRYDTYCENIFAKHFDITDLQSYNRFDLLTAFEVFEHLEDPIKEVESMLNYSDVIMFSTELQPAGDLNPDNWWYFTPETGQHITLYSLSSLEALAVRMGLYLYSNQTSLHILSKKKIAINPFIEKRPPLIGRLLHYFERKYSAVNNRESLLMKDFLFIRNLSK